MKRDSYTNCWKAKIDDNIVIGQIFTLALEEYLNNTHCEIGIRVATKKNISPKSNSTKELCIERRRIRFPICCKSLEWNQLFGLLQMTQYLMLGNDTKTSLSPFHHPHQGPPMLIR